MSGLHTVNLATLANDAARRPPAPGNLELVRQFVNTTDIEAGTDEVPTPDALADWLATRGLLPADTGLTDADRARAIALREALRDVLQVHAGHPISADAARRFADLAATIPLQLAMEPEPRLVAEAATGIDTALGRLLGISFEAMATGTWSRLKVCRNDACRWAYYDSSRNRSGAWCTMAICGNRMKGRSFRARKGSAA